LIRLTRRRGLLVVTVPALRWLWSDWDVALHHKRRYERKAFVRLVAQPEVEVLRCAFFNTAALPLIALARSWRKLRPPKPWRARAEDRLPLRPVNALLRGLMVAPAVRTWVPAPAGASLIAVMRKR